MFKDVSEALTCIEREGVEFIDVRFCDLPGVMQHFTIPVDAFKDEALTQGLMFDGSSIRGFTAIHESDMKLVPDITTAFLDPFRARKTLIINFAIVDPFTDEVYSRDPRSIAAKAEDYLRSTGIADTCYIGAEAEFYLFDSVEYETTPATTRYAIDSAEAAWNTGRTEEGGNKGYKTAFKGGYFPVSPNDQMADIRDAMVRTCIESGLAIERAHHEVGTAGQQEINYRFNSLLAAGDDMMKFKYIIKNEAWRAGKTATFMPKPIFGDNGSGMHCHHSLWKDGRPLFFDERGYGQRQAADSVDLLGNDHLARLQIGHHAQQLGPVGARAGCLLAVDAGDVVPSSLRDRDDPLLALQILRVRADTQIDPRHHWAGIHVKAPSACRRRQSR